VTSTIGTPATDPNVISAGATTTYRIDLQDGYGGFQLPRRHRLAQQQHQLVQLGRRGAGRPDHLLVAPGELNWALCSTDIAIYTECTNDPAGKPTLLAERRHERVGTADRRASPRS
jgi:hypothetical protein